MPLRGKDSAKVVRHKHASIDLTACDPKTGLPYSAEAAKDNREILLLGENARLREKLNRVIDEAEKSISELVNSNDDVKSYYTRRELVLKKELEEATGDCAMYRTLSEATEIDLQQYGECFRELVHYIDVDKYNRGRHNRHHDGNLLWKWIDALCKGRRNLDKIDEGLAEFEDVWEHAKFQRTQQAENARAGTMYRVANEMEKEPTRLSLDSLEEQDHAESKSSPDPPKIEYSLSLKPQRENSSMELLTSDLRSTAKIADEPQINTSIEILQRFRKGAHTEAVRELQNQLAVAEQTLTSSRQQTVAALQQVEELYRLKDEGIDESPAEILKAKQLLHTIRRSEVFRSQSQSYPERSDRGSAVMSTHGNSANSDTLNYSRGSSSSSSTSQRWNHFEGEDDLMQKLSEANDAIEASKGETDAVLQLLEQLTQLQDSPALQTSNQRQMRERNILHNIKNKVGPLITGAATRTGMHPAYKAVPYTQRLKQIQRDKSTLSAQVREEDPEVNPESRHLPAYLEQKAPVRKLDGSKYKQTQLQVRRGKTTKSQEIGLVPKSLSLLSTPQPVRKRGGESNAFTNTSLGGSPVKDEETADASKQALKYAASFGGSIDGKYIDEDHAHVLHEYEVDVRSELEALWETRAPMGISNSSGNRRLFSGSKSEVHDEDESIDELKAMHHASAQPKTLADMMVFLTRKVGDDLIQLRNYRDNSDLGRLHLLNELKDVKENAATESAQLRSQLHTCNEELREMSVKCRNESDANVKLETELQNSKEEAEAMQKRLESTISRIKQELVESKNKLEDCTILWNHEEEKSSAAIAALKKELGERSVRHSDIVTRLEETIANNEKDFKNKMTRFHEVNNNRIENLEKEQAKYKTEQDQKLQHERRLVESAKNMHELAVADLENTKVKLRDLELNYSRIESIIQEKQQEHIDKVAVMQRQMDDRVFSLQKQINQFKSEAVEERERNDELTEQLESEINENTNVKKKVRTTERDIEKLRKQVEEYAEWAPALEDELAETKQKLENLQEQYDNDCEAWNQSSSHDEKQIASLTSQLNQKAENERRFHAQLTRLENQLKHSEEHSVEMQHAIEDAKQHEKAAVLENKQHEIELRQHEKDMEFEVRCAITRGQDLIKKHAELSEKFMKLSQELVLSRDREAALSRDLRIASTNKVTIELESKLKDALNTIEKEKANSTEIVSREKHLLEDLENMKQECSKNTKEIEEMKGRFDNERNSLQETIRRHLNDKVDLDDTIDGLQNDMSRLKIKINAAEDEKQHLEDNSRRLESEVSRLNKEVKEERRLKGKAFDSKDAAEKAAKVELNNLRHSLASYKIEAERGREAIVQLNDHLQAARTESANHKEHIARLLRVKEGLHAMLEEKAHNERVQEANQAQQAEEVEQAQAALDALKSLEEEDDDVNEEEQEALELLADTKSKLQESQEQLQKGENEKKQLEGKCKQLEGKCEQLDIKCKQLQNLCEIAVKREEEMQTMIEAEVSKAAKDIVAVELELSEAVADLHTERTEHQATRQKLSDTESKHRSALQQIQQQKKHHETSLQKHSTKAAQDMKMERQKVEEQKKEQLHRLQQTHQQNLTKMERTYEENLTSLANKHASHISDLHAKHAAAIKKNEEKFQDEINLLQQQHSREIGDLKKMLFSAEARAKVAIDEAETSKANAETVMKTAKTAGSSSAKLLEESKAVYEKELQALNVALDLRTSAQANDSKAASDEIAQLRSRIRDMEAVIAAAEETITKMTHELSQKGIELNAGASASAALARSIKTLQSEKNIALAELADLEELAKVQECEITACKGKNAEIQKKSVEYEHQVAQNTESMLKAHRIAIEELETRHTDKIKHLEDIIKLLREQLAEANTSVEGYGHLQVKLRECKKGQSKLLAAADESKKAALLQEQKIFEIVTESQALESKLQAKISTLESQLRSAHSEVVEVNEARLKMETRLQHLQTAYSGKLSREKEDEAAKRNLQNKVQSLKGDLKMLHEITEMPQHVSPHAHASEKAPTGMVKSPLSPHKSPAKSPTKGRARDKELESTRSVHKQELAAMKKKYEAMQVKYEEQLQIHRHEHAELQSQLDDSMAVCARSKAQVEALTSRVAHMDELLRVEPMKLRGEAEEMQAKIAAKEVANKRALAREIALEEEVEHLKQEQRNLSKLSSQLKREKIESSAQLAEQEVELTELRSQLTTVEASRGKDLQSKLSESEEAKKELSTLLANTKQDLKMTQINLNLAESTRKEIEAKMAEIRSQLIEREQELESARTTIALKDADISGYKARLAAQAKAHTDAILAMRQRIH